MRSFLALYFSFLLAAGAQQVGQNAAASGAAATFQSSTQLVIETVSVKGKDGKPIDNLSAKDFTVTEDGVPQTIRFFEYQKLQDTTPDVPSASESAGAAPLPKLPKSQITPEAPGNVKYQDHRLL